MEQRASLVTLGVADAGLEPADSAGFQGVAIVHNPGFPLADDGSLTVPDSIRPETFALACGWHLRT